MTFVPEAERPTRLSKALDVVAARQADVQQAEAEVRSATAGLDAAKGEDRAAYAAARDAGKGDPGPVHEREAHAHREDCERQLEGERLRLSTAEQAFAETLRAVAAEWSGTLQGAVEIAEVESLRALGAFEAAEARHTELRAAVSWLEQYMRTGQLLKHAVAGQVRSTLRIHPNNPDMHPVSALVAGIREGLQAGTMAAQREREAERQAAEAQAEERRAELRATREVGGR